MIDGEGAGIAYGQLAGIGLGIVQQILKTFEGTVFPNGNDVGTEGESEHGSQLGVAESHAREAFLQGNVRLGVEEQGISVWLDGHEIVAAYDSAAAGLVVYDHVHAQSFLDVGQGRAENAVGTGTGAEGADDGDGVVGIGGHGGSGTAEDGQAAEKCGGDFFHGSSVERG